MVALAKPRAEASVVSCPAGKYVIFRLGEEEFGIQVLRIREIIGMQEITAVPGTPSHLRGVINLRGKIIPVVDLRIQFGFPDSPFTDTTCILVVQVVQDGELARIGLIADGVCEVITFTAADVESAPDTANPIVAPFVLGVANHKGTNKLLLRIEDVLALQELRKVKV